jgi:NAD(P)H-hydrate epimerase
MIAGSDPILPCAETKELEARRFGGEEAREWPAMVRAGAALAEAVVADSAEIGGFPARGGRILVLVGKGHNGGDALLAAHRLVERFAAVTVDVVFVLGERALRPLAARAWRDLAATGAARSLPAAAWVRTAAAGPAYDVSLDGVFGFQFRPPVAAAVRRLFETANALPVRLRAAVDLPSAGLFRADFTYATGVVKAPVVGAAEAGRVRLLDLGFFERGAPGGERVLTRAVLEPLRRLRPAASDKRTFGHVFVVGGSRSFPGAVLMAVLAALRSGAGLVTAFVPESVAAAFAARAPEAMWVAWPETPGGGLALEGEHLLREKLERATALVIGPGLGREAETLALAGSVVRASPVPTVIDADALQPAIVAAGRGPRIVTPHAGEWARVQAAAGADPTLHVVQKGPVTRIWNADSPRYHSFFGGPVLARGGSGDLLAGLIGGLLAQAPDDPLAAAARGVVWHGCAADELARARGQVAVRTTELLDFLAAALRRD